MQKIHNNGNLKKWEMQFGLVPDMRSHDPNLTFLQVFDVELLELMNTITNSLSYTW